MSSLSLRVGSYFTSLSLFWVRILVFISGCIHDYFPWKLSYFTDGTYQRQDYIIMDIISFAILIRFNYKQFITVED